MTRALCLFVALAACRANLPAPVGCTPLTGGCVPLAYACVGG